MVRSAGGRTQAIQSYLAVRRPGGVAVAGKGSQSRCPTGASSTIERRCCPKRVAYAVTSAPPYEEPSNQPCRSPGLHAPPPCPAESDVTAQVEEAIAGTETGDVAMERRRCVQPWATTRLILGFFVRRRGRNRVCDALRTAPALDRA